MDMESPQDETTVLLDAEGKRPASGPLTDAVTPSPRVEHLHERMIYAARQPHSQMFVASLNPLVTAASGLLSQVVLLRQGRDRGDLNMLKQELALDLKDFEAHALRLNVVESQLIAARYVLCTVLDEAVVAAPGGQGSNWSQISLLSSFHNETFGGEKVFQLLDRLSKDPVKHLHMLELSYLCLSLGFEGKYGMHARGGFELEGVRDALYRAIRHVRGDPPRQFSHVGDGFVAPRRAPMRIVPAWMVMVFALVSLGAMYSGFAWVLQEQRQSALQPYQLPEPVIAQPLP
ncbi:type IVB secretion system protein IcmH/DotU [Pseudomonas sp. FP198]|uniref:type IVB secretion system protein IcmH/DotU n=1 Tax=Pseudomonas sp. FP198 TaxID=2954084 RepID=UPI002733FC92|nr:type IVB secretion system protein IcmH/DotU [Pseudomonas sp. FP198]WLG95721.1 type IVB secretion system protein IcmH/DotU [Pseudomonas sp. FP198]